LVVQTYESRLQLTAYNCKLINKIDYKVQQHPINERINFLLKSFKISARAFSEAIGEKPTITQNYVGTRNSMPGADYLEKVMKHFDSINPAWLLSGEGEPFLADKLQASTTQTDNFNQAGTSNTQKVKGNKNNVQNNNGDHATITNNVKLENCKRDLATAEKEIQHLRDKLVAAEALVASKDVTIAAKEEMISLLRATYNRPN
jgi:hypothetical protein